MKRSFVLVFVLAALILSLAMPLGSVMAAGKTATLVEFKHVDGKGWTLVFKIGGDWKQADLKGNTIKVGNNTYPLSCNFRDDNHVSCTMQGLGKNVGTSAVAHFGGQSYSATVPSRQICDGYGVYGWVQMWTGEGDEFDWAWGYIEIPAEHYDWAANSEYYQLWGSPDCLEHATDWKFWWTGDWSY
jgi:hypothetical protein